jgi:hypothetical protein
MWQDWYLTFGFVIFSIALIPMLRDKNKPALLTGLITSLVLLGEIPVYYSLGLWLATILTFVNLVMWSTLTVQRWKQNASKA